MSPGTSPTAAAEAVVLTRRGPALWARIDRPEAGNACSSEVMAGLEEWVARGADGDVRVLVLTGTGTAFCAGADLVEATGLLDDPARLAAFLDRGRALVRSVRGAAVPTLAAVNGAAFGGGLELLLACDLAVAAESARIGDRHVSVGQVPGWGSSVMLPQAVGAARARRLLLAGESWSASEAAAHGLVSEAAPDSELGARVQALAERIAALDPEAVRRMLRVARPADEAALWARERDVLMEHVGRTRP